MRLVLLAWAITFQMNLKAQQHHTEQPVIKNIPEILVKPSLGVMRISRDTIEYRVGNTLSPEIVKLEDLFRNFLGFNITDNGRIFYNGKEVSFLLIDGDPVSFSDYSIISQHLNANMFSSIEVIQQYQMNRFNGLSSNKNELAINLKMKKEFRGKFNNDLTVKAASTRGLYGMMDLSRIGGHIKSIAVVEKNIYGMRWEMKNTSILNNHEFKVPLISPIEYPLLVKTNLFKQSYLFNNKGYELKMLHAFKLSPYSTIRLEAGNGKIIFDFKEEQQNKYFIGGDNYLNQQRNSTLNLSTGNRYMKLMFDHDHFKNSRGEYKLFFIYQALKQQLLDSIKTDVTLFNYAWDDQRGKLIVFQGLEKYLIGKRYLLEVGFQGGFNNVYRQMQRNYIEKNEFEILQKYVSTVVGLSFQKLKHSFHIGHRFVKEHRELSTAFLKQYVFVEHQYRLNKNLFYNNDISFGRGEISSKESHAAKTIYRLEGGVTYKRSMFNQTYLKYFVSQKIPTIETWIVNPLLYLSGYTQYQYIPDRFSLMRNVELGKSYQHLFRGFGFNYSFISSYIKNDVLHSIGFHLLNIVDTIRYENNSRNIQFRAEADQFIFPLKIRISTSLQFTFARMNQGMMGVVIPMTLNNQYFKLNFKSSWEKSFHWELSSSIQRNQSNTGSNKNNIIFFNHQLNSKYKISRKIFTAFQSTFIQTQKQYRYMFLDVLTQLKASEKFSIHISVLNVMDVKRFQQTYISTYGTQSNSTPLAGRKFQIEFRKSF
jgi:hypothetical protein